jgi:hypothetical protein
VVVVGQSAELHLLTGPLSIPQIADE